MICISLFNYFGTEAPNYDTVRAVRFQAAADETLARTRRTHVANGGVSMARPNYSYEKRQKELAKQKKNEEKRLRKMAKRQEGEATDEVELSETGEPAEAGEAAESSETGETTA